MSFLLSSDGFSSAVERANELLSNSPLPIPLCQDLPEIERVYLLFLQGTSTIRAVHFGKVLRLLPFSLRSEDDKLKFVQHISISRAIHHESIVAPVGCVKGENFPNEVYLAYDIDNALSWQDFSSNANLSWTQRATAVKNLASAMQLCSLYNAHFSELHSDNVLVEESKNVKIMGIISMEPSHLHDQYAHELFSLGSLALTCISWGKISSSKEEISIYDPEFLLWQQQFIPLDCPEVFEALAYACCDVHAPELPSLTYITEQLTTLIPDVKAWEEQLEKQQRAVLHSDAMGAARTAKRFSILFNADEFHEQLTQMPPPTFDQSENLSLLETPSRLSGTAAPMNQRRASHRAIRPSLYVPRTAPAGPPDSLHTSQESDVPVPLLRLNGQLLELEYELAQSVQDLENPFVRMEWEQHNPEALHRVLGSIQHCMKHIRSHINHLQSAITNESMAITDDIPVRIDEDTVHNHVPSFAQRSPSLSSVPLCEEEGYISPPESIPTVLPPGRISSATTKLFAALEDGEEDEEGEEGEEEGNEDEHSTTENRENGESPVSRRESGRWSPAAAAAVADDAGDESPISPSFEDTPSNEDRPDTAAENATSAGDATITTTTTITAPVAVAAVVVDTTTTMKKQTSLRTLAFVSGEVSERETLHPQPTHAVASEASPASVTWSTTLANPTLLRGNLQVGDEGAHEMAEVVVTPPPKLSRPPSVVRRHSSTSIHPTSTPNSRAHSRSSSFVAKAREEIELKVSGKSPLGSRSGSPRAPSADAPFPPPPPPPPPSTKSSSQAPSPASSLPSSRRPSASGTTTTATAAAHHPPPPPPPPPSRRTSLLIDAASMVGYETHEMMVEDTLTLAALPVESSPSSEPSSHAPIEATSLETPPVVPIPPPPPPPKRPSVTMAPVPAPAPVVPPSAEPNTVSDEKMTFSSIEPPVDVTIAHDSRPLTTDDLQLPATRDPDSSPSVGSESSSPADHRFSGGEPHRQAVRWSETTDFAIDAPAAASTVAATSADNVKASSVRVPPPISTAAATLDVPLSSLTSPLASASHFLDRIRHLDEMFSTMTTGETGTSAMSSEEKRRSPIGYHQQQQPSSSGHHHSAHSSPSMMAPPTYAGGGGGGGYVSSVSPQYSPYGGGYGYPHGRSTDYAAGAAAAAAGVSPSLRSPPPPSPSSPSFAAAAAATHNLATMEREQAQNTQIHQTFQMYLSLVQRCSNTSARAKQVLDHLDQQMATVSSPTAASYGRSGAGASSSLRRPHSFAAGSAGSSSSSSYGGGTRSSPTHQVAPSYMQPTRSARYGGESSAYHSGVHRTPSADASSMGGGALSRSSSYSNLRTGAGGGGSITSGSYMIHGGGGSLSGMLPFATGDDPAMPLRTSSSSGASVYSRPMSSASSSRSNSNQRGRNTTAVRSPIAKEILSNRPNPRVYSISPRKQR